MHDKKSRYAGSTPVTAADGIEWMPDRPKVMKKDYRDNTVHTAIAGEDLMLLSWMYLESEKFWWVIADMNDINNGLIQFEGGEQIIIPSIRTLHEDILPAVIG